MANIWPDVHCLQAKFRGTQREILRKGPKTITKHDSKLSEVILKSILAECWKKFICSSLSARTDGAVPSQQGALTTCNLTNQEVSPQTYVQTILASLGVVLRQNSPTVIQKGQGPTNWIHWGELTKKLRSQGRIQKVRKGVQLCYIFVY